MLLLIGLSCPPLWFCLAGAWVPMSLASFTKYQQMRRQERNPDKLRIEGDELLYLSEGKPILSISFSAITRIEAKSGVQIFMQASKRITILDSNFPLAKFLVQSKRQKCDLFFPWFSILAKTRLQDIVHANQSHNAGSF
jgi:hypothetical protein